MGEQEKDKIERAISEKFGLRFIFVDVTKTAKELERRHLCGPAATKMLGEGLIAAALLSSKFKNSDERITMQFKVDGPLKGLLVESSGEGGLRGYTDIKTFDRLDAEQGIDSSSILGSHGILTIIHSNKKRTLYSGQIALDPPDIRIATAKYFNQSEQIPTGVEFHSSMKDFRTGRMKGFMVQKMPGADTEKFVEILELLHRNELSEKLAEASAIYDFKDIMNIEDLALMEEKKLRFFCGCSYEKSVSIMSTLSIPELQEIIRKGEPERVTCHFCGETYKIKKEDISEVLLHKADTEKPV